MELPFLKMHGAANDFVVLDRLGSKAPQPSAEQMRQWCDRRRGIGADGVLLLESDPELDFRMRYFNADGGSAEYCGNGARCLACLALELGLGRGGEVRFRTDIGVQSARQVAEHRYEVRFGRVARPERREDLAAAGRRFSGWWVQAGVPHLVIEVDRVSEVPVREWGAALRAHPQFGAEGANVDFVERRGVSHVAMRTFERGVEGETLACGSGAIACGITRAMSGDRSPVTVTTAGGDDLRVTWQATDEDYEVGLEGPAEIAFTGRLRVSSAVPLVR
ncbi:MAG TPA: diaminopimelate epimerase [Candidatus Sulfotelmatobacter sp.]|nr:diaminopimelate epimerase [Candidatus Sulfotelmatobacter sp.]